MFKLSRPMKLALSSSGISLLLALGSLASTSNTVVASDIKEAPVNNDGIVSTPLHSKESTTDSSLVNQRAAQLDSKSNVHDVRHRSGRMYHYANHQSMPIESYASAYAAANSFGSADQASNRHLTQQSTADATAYTSFGEAPPQSGSSIAPSSASRQLSSSSDYAPSTSPNYFASYMSPSSNEASYSGQSNYHSINNHHSPHHYYKTPSTLPLGYPSNSYDRYPMSGYYDRVAHHASASTPLWASTHFNSGGLMSSATNAISHWTNGFSIGEIICGIVAIAIGAVILGAPFFLIYLALMGNFSGSGTLSLTNPTQGAAAPGGASTTVNGRRKRLAVFDAMDVNESTGRPDLAMIVDSVARHISPFVDLQQVSRTFKHLAKSVERYSPELKKVDNSANKKSS